MNPDTNKLEALTTTTPEMAKQLEALEEQAKAFQSELVRPNGEPVPKHWAVFKQGEDVVVKDYTFKVAHMNESCIVLEPVGPYVVGGK
jgi:hypothetical protein